MLSKIKPSSHYRILRTNIREKLQILRKNKLDKIESIINQHILEQNKNSFSVSNNVNKPSELTFVFDSGVASKLEFVIKKNKDNTLMFTTNIKMQEVTFANVFKHCVDDFYDKYTNFKNLVSFFHENKDYVISLIDFFYENDIKILKLDKKLIDNNHNIFLADSKNKLDKICRIFPVTPIENLDTLIQREHFKKTACERITKPSDNIKVPFMNYFFSKHCVVFQSLSFRVYKYNTEQEYYKHNGEVVTREIIEKLLSQSFSFEDKIIRKKSDIDFLKLSNKGNISYENIFESIKQPLLKLNIVDF